jgi:hypothetical protein
MKYKTLKWKSFWVTEIMLIYKQCRIKGNENLFGELFVLLSTRRISHKNINHLFSDTSLFGSCNNSNMSVMKEMVDE